MYFRKAAEDGLEDCGGGEERVEIERSEGWRDSMACGVLSVV